MPQSEQCRCVVRKFHLWVETVYVEDFRQLQNPSSVTCGFDGRVREGDLRGEKPVENSVDNFRIFLFKCGKNRVGHMRIDLRENLFTTFGEPKDMARPARAFADADERDQSLRGKGEEVLTNGAS